MKTCFLVTSKVDLWRKLSDFNSFTGEPRKDEDKICSSPNIRNSDDLIIKNYINDDRNGWNTQIVLVKSQCVTRDPYVIGFLSEPFEQGNS